MASQNLEPFKYLDLPHHALAFDKITPEIFLPALKENLAAAKKQISRIRDDVEPATFKNTIVALETAGEDADLVSTTFYNLLHAHTNDQLQNLALEIGPLLANYASDILLDTKLFARIKSLYELREKLNLNVEESKLLEKYYLDFVRNGALLDDEKKSELRKIDEELSKLSPQFSDNVLKATNEFTLHLTKRDEVAGLPAIVLTAAAAAAKEKNLDGWLFTLQMPSYIPFMQFAAHRPSREKMYRAYGSRAFGGNFDNRKLILQILKLREKRARLLGYKNHAEFMLERRMAESPDRVMQFLKRIEVASLPAARRDVKEIEDFAKSKGAPVPLEPWDFAYWSERLKEKRFEFSQDDLRPYFKLENVVKGAFEHARRLYGLMFKESDAYPVWHPDVKTFEVSDEKTNEFVGLFYADFYPRESKSGGAWMTNYFEQGLFHGQVDHPHVSVVCNFTKPSANEPSLLTFDEVNTLFHEFGHSLHSLLSRCRYRSLAGTNVYWDFVELPSQIMENWIKEKESLDIFARHYKTGELIPADLVKKIKDSSRYLAGYQSLRQVMLANLDMAWHTADSSKISDVAKFEDQVADRLRVLPKVEGINITCSFSHIFGGGYSDGYYSYKWAESLDAEAFEYFKECGLFNKDVAQKFRENILSRGGTEHPMELYKRFRGREPDPDALLRRDGLIDEVT